jgi:BioD-like phosphotransacetylase family protein
MINLYLVSIEPYSGKTAICFALGLHYQQKGLKVKYMKPVSNMVMIKGQPGSWDAAFLKDKMGMNEPEELISPVLISGANWEEMMKSPATWKGRISEAHRRLSQDCDLMLLEGAMNMIQGYFLNLSATHIASLLDASVILVMSYQPDLFISAILDARDRLAGRLSGIIVNRVPEKLIDKVSEQMNRVMGFYKIPVYGILAEDTLLCSISVKELADILNGNIICCDDSGETMVETFSVGAMNIDQALTHFRRIPRKAVITGGDRVDIQLAALQTDTRCLILTGNLYPAQVVITQPTARHVPIIVVGSDTMRTVQLVDEVLGHIQLRHASQIERLREMVELQPGLKELDKSLGLTA